MITFDKFSGINNVLPTEKLGKKELRVARNVNIGLAGEVTRRKGYAATVNTCHKNLWQGDGFLAATCDGDLTTIDGATRTVVYPSLGVDRVWYCNMPDGRTSFSNGMINGLMTAGGATGWGVPIPPSVGALTEIGGGLFPGDYQWQITYVRLSDGVEGGPAYSNPVPVSSGGIFLSGLPVLDGYKINVYLTGANGGNGFYAGTTTTGIFSFVGKNDDLALPCRTEFAGPAPVGTVTAFWRGRALVAVGPVLYASRTNQIELFDLRRDFKQFTAKITLIQPVDDGIYVGTEAELVFLHGTTWDALKLEQALSGRVVLGSGVAVDGEYIKHRDAMGDGQAMICIAAGGVVAGFNGGVIERLTMGRYATPYTEVVATFRRVDEIPQYLASPV